MKSILSEIIEQKTLLTCNYFQHNNFFYFSLGYPIYIQQTSAENKNKNIEPKEIIRILVGHGLGGGFEIAILC